MKNRYKAMNQNSLIPKLKTGQRSVVFAEINTGILLTFRGERYTGQAACYRIFNSESEAIAFARVYIGQHPKTECSIRDEEGKHLQFIRNER